jgi:peptide/nickel transport system ATP-binding protein
MSVLEARDLVVEFRQRGGDALRAVDNCSLRLEKGETLALVGESGSGKSTIVRALGQLTKPTSGSVVLDGKPAGRHGRGLRAYRKRVQLIFQDPFASLNPMHTVHYHLSRPLLRLHPGVSRARMSEMVIELLQSVNLTPASEVARKHPHELSGGQRQRVAIARALASAPDVLLADEPVSMLDVSIRLEILNLLDRLKRERNLALLYVTHDLATARHFSSRIMVMYRGQIVEYGPADEVILRPAHPYTQLLAAAAPNPGVPRAQLVEARRAREAARAAAGGAAARTGTGTGGDAAEGERREILLDEGCRFRLRCPHAMDVCATAPPDALVSESASANGVAPAAAEPHHALCWLHAPSSVASATKAS